MKFNTKTLTTLAMLCALSFLAVFILRIPVFIFLSYEPKDVIIAIGGFIFGPMAACIVSVVVSLVEMVTISDTGIIGCVMNILGTCAFTCTAAFIYKRNHTAKGAIIGLASGVLLMTGVMLLWNYLITPLYMNVPREQVVGMLMPVFLPFNLLKGGINAAVTMLLYKPVVTLLRRMRLVADSANEGGRANTKGIVLLSVAALATFALLMLVMNGVI